MCGCTSAFSGNTSVGLNGRHSPEISNYMGKGSNAGLNGRHSPDINSRHDYAVSDRHSPGLNGRHSPDISNFLSPGLVGRHSPDINSRHDYAVSDRHSPDVASNSLRGNRFSNLTTESATQQCSDEINADDYTSDVAYYNDLNKCIAAKKKAASDKITGYIDMGTNLLKNIGQIFGTVNNPPPAPTTDIYGPGGYPPPTPTKGMSAGVWIAIIGGLAIVTAITVVIVKKGKKSK